MFRSVIGRIVASAAGVQVCAAGVALTDKQLSRKPDWYQKDVHALEDSLKKLGRHGFNTSPSAVNESYETLKKYAHISNVEIHWRMARALLEKSYFTKCPTERAHLVHEVHLLTDISISIAKFGSLDVRCYKQDVICKAEMMYTTVQKESTSNFFAKTHFEINVFD